MVSLVWRGCWKARLHPFTGSRLNQPEGGPSAWKPGKKPGLDRGKAIAYTAPPLWKLSRSRDAGWSSPVARQAHNLKVTGSNPVPATIKENAPEVGGVFIWMP